MLIETERLELVALNAEEICLWCNDIEKLEKRLSCRCRAEPMEGFFLEIVRGQCEITAKDPENYFWHSFFLIIRKSDRVVVGSADFKNIPDENGEVEIGYGLGREFEHNGYMTETVRAMTEWALAQQKVNAVIAETEKDNKPSQHILERCGYTIYKTQDTLWWKITE